MSGYPLREVSFEIAGPAAMFTRPDTGATPISYPVPTYSAVKGMFEAVARRGRAYISPTRVEICEPIRYESYITNYGGPLRKPEQIRKGNNYQLLATILVDVRYRAYGVVEVTGSGVGRINPGHALEDIFQRRLRNGQCFYIPCLGWKEFIPSYFGPLRTDSRPDESLDLIIPSLLYSVFDSPTNGEVKPSYRRNVRVQHGVLRYEVEDSSAH